MPLQPLIDYCIENAAQIAEEATYSSSSIFGVWMATGEIKTGWLSRNGWQSPDFIGFAPAGYGQRLTTNDVIEKVQRL